LWFGARVNQLAGHGCEDVATLPPEIRRRPPLAFLLSRVVAQQRHQLVWKTDPAPAGP
jgi:hypothetical protein